MAEGKDTLLFYSRVDDPEPWRAAFASELPAADFRIFPDVPDPAAVTAAIVWAPPHGFFSQFANLRLVVNIGVGVDSLIGRDDLPNVPILRLSDPGMVAMMTSYVLFAVIRYARDIDKFEAGQRARQWLRIEQRPLASYTVGVLGLGELGSSASQALAGRGFDVVGWSRSPKNLRGVRSVHGMDALDAVLAEAEILVLMLPLTPATRGLMNEVRLRKMRRGAKLINVARGPVVDEPALIAALTDGHLGGATLDVFVEEPLPPESPFWTMPNVLVTPHRASNPNAAAAAKIVAESIRRMSRGEPPLYAVDPKRGY